MANDGNESVLSALLPSEVAGMLAEGALEGMFAGADLSEDSPASDAVAAARAAADKIDEARTTRRTVRHSEMHNLETADGRTAWAEVMTKLTGLVLDGEARAVVVERLQLKQGYSGYVEWDEFEEAKDGEKK